jgi:hypothetical protein
MRYLDSTSVARTAQSGEARRTHSSPYIVPPHARCLPYRPVCLEPCAARQWLRLCQVAQHPQVRTCVSYVYMHWHVIGRDGPASRAPSAVVTQTGSPFRNRHLISSLSLSLFLSTPMRSRRHIHSRACQRTYGAALRYAGSSVRVSEPPRTASHPQRETGTSHSLGVQTSLTPSRKSSSIHVTAG